MEKKLQKIYLTDYNLLVVRDSLQAHYEILSIIFLKEFIKLNVNTDTMIKNVKLAELKINVKTVSLEFKNFKDDLIKNKCFIL